jgi:oligopeptide/dipeptide ABC transporter ATP-binding protein
MRQLGIALGMAQRATASGARLFEILDREPQLRSPAGAPPLPAGRGRVELRDVTFQYETAPSPALRDIDLAVEAGTTVALVGGTGSGKTTLVHLLARLYDVSTGAVLIDGADVREVELGSLRHAISVVDDDPFLFSASVHENIAYGRPEASREEVERAAEQAQAAGFIAELPSGYDTRIGERGLTLSGGQRQRIAIARALSTGAKLIVCDESVSALDVSTQNQVINLFEDIQRDEGTSYLFIAHDLSVVRHIAHRVMVMYLGRIVESGPVERVFRSPAHPYTEALLSAIPVPNPAVQRTRTRITLAGDPPDPSALPAGCAFHTRCRLAMPRCSIEIPIAQPVDGGGEAACHLLDLAAPVPLVGLAAEAPS